MTTKERNRCMKTAKECGYGNGVIDAIFKAETDAEVYRILATAREKKAKEYDERVLNLYHWKKLRKGIAFAGMMIAMCIPTCKAKADIYPECGKVVEVIDITETNPMDLITVETFNGNQFMFAVDQGDYEINDVIAMIMSDRNTETVTDDEVITAKYCGWMEE